MRDAPKNQPKRRIIYLDTSALLAEGLNHNVFERRTEAALAYTVVESDQFQLYLPFVTADSTLPTASQLSATRLFGLFVSSDLREALIGDLEERYGKMLHHVGDRAATRWFWRQVVLSFLSLALEALKRVSGLEKLMRRIGS